MKKVELSRLDFEVIDLALDMAFENTIKSEHTVNFARSTQQLRDLFRAAHTGWLEVEDEND